MWAATLQDMPSCGRNCGPNGLLDDIAVYPEMDAEALTERLARILFVADVYGRPDEPPFGMRGHILS